MFDGFRAWCSKPDSRSSKSKHDHRLNSKRREVDSPSERTSKAPRHSHDRNAGSEKRSVATLETKPSLPLAQKVLMVDLLQFSVGTSNSIC